VRALVREGFTAAERVGSWGYSFRGPVKLLLDHVLYHAGASGIRTVRVTRLDDPAGGDRVFGSDHHPLLAHVELAAP
jgi:endonuclease/exonuclease/phosphatase (EEP) superfamily protein YafD